MKIIKLVSSSNDIIKIDSMYMNLSSIILELSENDNNEEIEVSLPFNTQVIKLVVDFCEYYSTDPLVLTNCNPLGTNDINQLMQKWYVEYINIPSELVFELMNIANYLIIEELIELTSVKIATILKGKSPEQIREHFNIKDTFTQEEKHEFRQSHAWANY